MTQQKRTRNFMSDPERPSFLEELYQGHFRWDLLHPFPEQDPADRAHGEEAVAALTGFLRERVDPVTVDAEGRLPDGLIEEMRERGYLGLRLGPEHGGLGLSHFNTFRLIEAAASWCFPVALIMGIENSVGVPAFLPLVAEGPLKELLLKHLESGGLSGTADTEPQGAANQRRFTTAEPVDGGSAYVLNGCKILVGHAPDGGMFSVTAEVTEDGVTGNRVFFVDSTTPGFHHGQWHEFSGIRGFPNGWITLENVRVPAEHQLVEARAAHQARLTPAVSRLVVRGRLHMITAPSLAVAKNCLIWARDFVNRRRIDGSPLGEYEEIQRRLADSLAETFAVESVARAALITEDLGLARNVTFEQNAAKNIGSVTAGHIADRTMSLLAGEGYETARSKARRGAHAVPLEQAARDVRNMRISGGVDFQIDNWIAGRHILSYYYPQPGEETGPLPAAEPGPESSPVPEHEAEYEAEFEFGDGPGETSLTVRNRAHLKAVAAGVRAFGQACRELALRHPERARLLARERVVILLSRISSELFTQAAALARASQMTSAADVAGHGDAQRLADLYCTTASHRLAALWHRFESLTADAGDDSTRHGDADFAGMAADWLAAGADHHLSRDVDPTTGTETFQITGALMGADTRSPV